jgi:hypothetical protein
MKFSFPNCHNNCSNAQYMQVEDTVLNSLPLLWHVTRALHGPKRRLNLGHGCALGRSTVEIDLGQRALLGSGQGRARGRREGTQGRQGPELTHEAQSSQGP